MIPFYQFRSDYTSFLGHSKIETTAIYANALGQEQRDIAARMWE